VIVTRHRNGPVGSCKVLFGPQLTDFSILVAPQGGISVKDWLVMTDLSRTWWRSFPRSNQSD